MSFFLVMVDGSKMVDVGRLTKVSTFDTGYRV